MKSNACDSKLHKYCNPCDCDCHDFELSYEVQSILADIKEQVSIAEEAYGQIVNPKLWDKLKVKL